MLKFYIINPESSSFLANNAEWIFPLIVTILLTIISLQNEWRQKQLAEYEVGISLMEKRMSFFDKERVVLEKIIDKDKPSQTELTALCHAEHEAMFLFGHEVKEHIDKVLSLVDEFMKYKPVTIPDGFGGNVIVSDADADEYAHQAIGLFSEAISIYQLYIDFSSIGLAHAKERRVPFRNMIYIGDGLTDVPCMKLVKTNGGQSIAVYDPEKGKSAAETLLRDNRVNYVVPADYSADSDIETIVFAIIKKMQAESEMLSYR